MKRYRSKFEARFAARHADAQYEAVKLTYTIEHTYNPDWVLPNGVIVETKGRFLGADRSKMLAVKRQHPHLDIRFVFQRNDRLSKTSKTTYGSWCDRHGFPWAVGDVPTDWLAQ